MKLSITISALCAIAVGLIVLLTVDDGSTITSKQIEVAELTQQAANESQLQELARKIEDESLEIRPLPLIEPAQHSAVHPAKFLLPDNDAPSFKPLPRLDPQSPPQQWDVRQVSFLSPVETPKPAEPLVLGPTTQQPIIETESVLIVPAPARSFEVASLQDQDFESENPIKLPTADDGGADQEYVEKSEEIADLLKGEDTDGSFDEDELESIEGDFTTPADPGGGDGDESGAPSNSQSFAEAPYVQPPNWIPNEAQQISSILQQISNQRVTGAANQIRWSLDDAIMASLVHSNQIASLRIESVEELQNVGVEYGEFDVAAFVEQSFQDSSEPVGSSIDTASGTQPIVQEEDFNIAYGLRRQLRSGGEFEISQSYQIRDNDSGILVPDDQAFARLNGRLTKELLRGAGRSIAMNQVLVAFHDASAQRSESVAGIADHLNEVMTAYWDIFAARGALFASIENRQMAIQVRMELNARRDIDAEPNLLDQSEATIRQRELQINQAHSDLVRAQIQFISLVNAPELLDNSNNIEILPQVTPDLEFRQLDVASRVNTAIQRRPEISDIIEQIRSAQVSDHLSLNELLPQLSLSLEASLNGLEGDRQLGDAIGNQFENDLTYQFGVDFEVPLANRRARFTKRRTELAVARLSADWQVLVQEVKADVLDNAQEFLATQQRMQTQREVLKFTASELRYLGLRKTVAPKETDNVSFALTQVLSAQDRQGEAKTDFIAAIADKHRAIFELNRATGILINSDVIPLDGGPGCPDCFSVYHQFIEDRGALNCDLNVVESETKAKSDCGGKFGVGLLKLDSCSCRSGSCHSCRTQATCGPACQSCEEVIQVQNVIPVNVIPVVAEVPATAAPPRYQLR